MKTVLSVFRMTILGLALLCLSACQAAEETDAADAVRAAFGGGWEGEAAVIADFGDRLGQYRLRLSGDAEGKMSVVVVEPTVIAGLTAHLLPDAVQLQYDDVILETGILPGSGLTPMDALPALLRVWQSGYATSVGEETVDGVDCWHITYGGTGAEEYQTWFDKATLTPVRAETLADGVLILNITFIR